MKKIISYLLILVLVLCSGCSSSKKNKDDILTFFTAFDNTLSLDSGHIQGQFKMEKSEPYDIKVDCSFIQTGNLSVSITTDIAAEENKQEDYLQFFIQDGKTYLNSMGTKTQSSLDKLNLKPDSKIDIINPFLSFSDDILVSLFTSSKKEGNHYTFTIDPSQLASLLDNLGTLQISSSTLECDIQKNVLENMTLKASGTQKINDDQFDFDLTLSLQIDQINSVSSIPYPDDLDTYTNAYE